MVCIGSMQKNSLLDFLCCYLAAVHIFVQFSLDQNVSDPSKSSVRSNGHSVRGKLLMLSSQGCIAKVV
jgi:hypothetical protein